VPYGRGDIKDSQRKENLGRRGPAQEKGKRKEGTTDMEL